jgi:hypothetical protein
MPILSAPFAISGILSSVRFERATIPWNLGVSVEISEDFAACGARRSGSYVNMVQVVFPEHYLAVYRRGAGKNDQ